MPNNALTRQVFPPGRIGDLLYEAGKLPGEAGNAWGKLNAAASTAKDQIMMPMNALINRAFPGQFQRPVQAQMQGPPAQPPMPQAPQSTMGPPQPPMMHQMPPNMGGPGMRPGVMTMQPAGAPQSNLMPVNQPMTVGAPMGQPQQLPPAPVNNIYAQRMARF